MKQRINLRAACVNDDGLPEKHLLKRRVEDRFILNADFYKLRQQSLQKQTLNRTIYTLAVFLPSCLPVSTDQRCCLARDRGAASFGAEVLSRSGLGGTPRSGLGGTPRSGLGGTPRSGCRGSSEQGEQLDSGGASNSLRAGRATRFEQGGQLASSRACNSLRAGRATRFGRGEQLASGGASNTLRAGRVTRSERGEQLASGGANNSLRAGRTTRSERGGRNRAESTALFKCSSLKLYIRPIIFTPCRFFLSTVLLRFLILNPRQAD